MATNSDFRYDDLERRLSVLELVVARSTSAPSVPSTTSKDTVSRFTKEIFEEGFTCEERADPEIPGEWAYEFVVTASGDQAHIERCIAQWHDRLGSLPMDERRFFRLLMT